MATQPQIPANDTDQTVSAKLDGYDINDRLSCELVIAFVGPVGSGSTTTCKLIQDELADKFGYDNVYIRLSGLIKQHAHEVGQTIPDEISVSDRIDRYQNVGNELRRKFGESYLADRAVEQIAIERDKRGGYQKIDGRRVVLPTRRAYFLDSLKNPAELRRLRQVYGDLLWVVSVFAPEDVRFNRLINSGMSDPDTRHAMKRDYEEETREGQKVSKIAHQANYFVRNSSDLKDNLKAPVDRLLEAIFGTKLHTPTGDEKGMMEASSAAVRSACLSRQVGAAIYTDRGELIGVGCNDVPQAGGGLYAEGPNDNRCFHWKDKICHNDKRKADLASAIADSLGSTAEDRVRIVSDAMDSGVSNLIEFSRSVHAEMEAIVSVARMGSGSTMNGTLFTTTFPCHNCARHIVAAGITTVYYIEPYSKSLALDLHSDSISLLEEAHGKVRFLQYQGFAPRTSLRLFSSAGKERKKDGAYVEAPSAHAMPVFASPLDSYTTSENLIIQKLNPSETADG